MTIYTIFEYRMHLLYCTVLYMTFREGVFVNLGVCTILNLSSRLQWTATLPLLFPLPRRYVMPPVPVAAPAQHVDEGGEIVLNRFYDFLAKFTSAAEGTTDGTEGVQLYRDYLAQISAMVQNDKNTVYVDVQHIFAVT